MGGRCLSTTVTSLHQPYLDHKVSTLLWNTQYWVGNRSPTCSPPGCTMWPVATFITLMYTTKIHKKLRQLYIALITFPRVAHCPKKVGDPWTRTLGCAQLIAGSFIAAHSLIVSSLCLFTHRNRTSEHSVFSHVSYCCS